MQPPGGGSESASAVEERACSVVTRNDPQRRARWDPGPIVYPSIRYSKANKGPCEGQAETPYAGTISFC